ncbi:MAG TPA: hypothetical protein ENG83_13165 [Nitrospirae bacterium]|nr:hypothetical protein BMS3Abin06_01829 [bacterium BMS3Abin06]HDH13126.1 hypothetical protein [Nitrospirota bacterium]HDZ03318.1 hypothetical protein [Nitrospirota bacterium]
MKKIYALLFVTILMAFGCASDNEKPSADSLLYTEALNSINSIISAYGEKNIKSLRKLTAPNLSEDIVKNLFFKKADVSFVVKIVRIKGSSVIVDLNWKGEWQLENDGKIENRGVASLVLNKETMVLLNIDGDNPFIVPASMY